MPQDSQDYSGQNFRGLALDDRYTLATGDNGAHRLSILNTIHKPYSEFLFRQVGLKPGMSIADIGCGTGNVSHWLAQQVGSAGSVCGVDISAAQLEKAQQNAMAEGLSNIKFTLGNAYNTGLSENSFDLVYCRFLLMHLTRPADALYHMQSLLKPNGFLVCEEADFSSAFCDPPSRAYERCFELFLTISDIRGQHFRLGTMLYRLFQDVGLVAPSVSLVQPVVVRAETKSLVDLSLFEAVDAFIQAELTTQQEIEQTLVQIRALAADETTIFGIPRVTQVWAQK